MPLARPSLTLGGKQSDDSKNHFGWSRRLRAGGFGLDGGLFLHTRRRPPRLWRGGYPHLPERGRNRRAGLAGSPAQQPDGDAGRRRRRRSGRGGRRNPDNPCALRPGAYERKRAHPEAGKPSPYPPGKLHPAHDDPHPGCGGGEKPPGPLSQAGQPGADGRGPLHGPKGPGSGRHAGARRALPLLEALRPSPGIL